LVEELWPSASKLKTVGFAKVLVLGEEGLVESNLLQFLVPGNHQLICDGGRCCVC
jgi:hypothetical protein